MLRSGVVTMSLKIDGDEKDYAVRVVLAPESTREQAMASLARMARMATNRLALPADQLAEIDHT